MFERICVRTLEPARGPQLDLGILAETLIFYGKVHLVANRSTMAQLVEALGAELTLRLIEQDYVSVEYCNRFSAVVTNDAGTVHESHTLTLAEMPHTSADRVVPDLFVVATGKAGRGRRLGRRALARVTQVDFDDSLTLAAVEDSRDPLYVAGVAKDVIAALAPDFVLPSHSVFEVEPIDDDRVRVNTNIDFAAVTVVHQRRFNSDVHVNPALVLAELAAVHEDLALAASFDSEIATSALSSSLVRRKLTSLTSIGDRSRQQLAEFQEFVFGESRAIAEAVRTRSVTFDEVLDVVDRGRRFHEWLDGKASDVSLVEEYFRDCTRSSRLDALPAKLARWLLVTGTSTVTGTVFAGPVGTVAGLAIGTGDFLVDLLRHGWTPNQFVEGQLKQIGGRREH